MSAALIQADLDAEAQSELEAVVGKIADFEQISLPLTHYFSPGIYMREIFMPKGAFVIGHKHKTQHLNVVLSGSARVMVDGHIYDMKAPYIMESGPGARKVAFIEEDMRWATIHVNPDDERDIAKLEERYIDVSEEFLKAKGNMTLEEFRMSEIKQMEEQKEVTQ